MPKRVPFIHKLLKNLDRVDRQSIQSHVLDIAEENDLYEEVLQNLNDGILILDQDLRVTFINRQAAAWYNSEISQFVSRHSEKLTERVVADFQILSPRELSLRAFLIPLLQTTGKKIMVILTNLSADKNTPTSDNNLPRIESLIRLAAGIAHEIGNPLNAIGVHIALLKKQLKDISDSKRKSFESTIEVLQSETARLDKIVRNFLKATRKTPLRFRSEDLNEILQDAIQFMTPELQARGIQIQFRSDAGLPPFLMDRERLRQTFINLIKNAMEAMPNGGVIRIQISHKDKIAMLHFKDEGRGIPETDLPHIFEAYYTTKEEGSGLGLMTVFNAVQEHGGRIEVASKVGKGTTFTLLLPIRQPKLQLPQYKSK